MTDHTDRFTRGSGVTSRAIEPEVTLWGVILAALRGMPWLRLLAVIVWGAGLWCTVLTAALFFDDVALQWLAAGVAQAALTALQSPIWRRWEYDGDQEYKRGWSGWNMFAVLVDIVLNLAGTSAFVTRMHEFPPVLAVVRLLSGQESGPLDPIIGMPALALAVLFGGLLAATPEKLWYA